MCASTFVVLSLSSTLLIASGELQQQRWQWHWQQSDGHGGGFVSRVRLDLCNGTRVPVPEAVEKSVVKNSDRSVCHETHGGDAFWHACRTWTAEVDQIVGAKQIGGVTQQRHLPSEKDGRQIGAKSTTSGWSFSGMLMNVGAYLSLRRVCTCDRTIKQLQYMASEHYITIAPASLWLFSFLPSWQQRQRR